jgi:hypothetical protein
MNAQKFIAAVNALSDDELLKLHGEQSLRLIDDEWLAIGAYNEIDGMQLSLPTVAVDAAAIRAYLTDAASDLVMNFYINHPLSETGFKRQVRELMQQHGATAFAAPAGQRAAVTLFVDSGEVVAETVGNPRHPYGAFLELQAPVPATDIEDRVQYWLDSGEAYRHYLSMNVCRYNC